MNNIGSDSSRKCSVGKENIRPSQPLSWAIAARDNMLLHDELGADWKACVTLWFELKSKLGYGVLAGTKVGPDLYILFDYISDFTTGGPSGGQPTPG